MKNIGSALMNPLALRTGLTLLAKLSSVGLMFAFNAYIGHHLGSQGAGLFFCL